MFTIFRENARVFLLLLLKLTALFNSRGSLICTVIISLFGQNWHFQGAAKEVNSVGELQSYGDQFSKFFVDLYCNNISVWTPLAFQGAGKEPPKRSCVVANLNTCTRARSVTIDAETP